MNQPPQINCTCSDFQKHQWCHHMPQGAVKTGWNPQQQESWQEKLRKSKQEERYNQILDFLFDSSRGEKQVFIDELAKIWIEAISTERQRVLEEVRGLVEGMKWGDELDDKYEGERFRRMVHNQALDDLLSALKEMEDKTL